MHDNDATLRPDARKTLVLVLAGGHGKRLRGLTCSRAKPAVPFGTRYRLIDFPLSNCINSGLRHIALLTQYRTESLAAHIASNWRRGGDSARARVEIWPADQSGGRPYRGTADAVYQNRDRIEAFEPDDVLVVASDHVYAMDYARMRATHACNRADLTISCVEMPIDQSHQFGVVETDERSRIRRFVEKPDRDTTVTLYGQRSAVLASMGIYLFDTQFLLDWLEADASNPESAHDFGYDLVPRMIASADVFAHPFRNDDGSPGYWRDVGTIDSYWAANRELLAASSNLDPGSLSWPIRGERASSAPTRIAPTAEIAGSQLGSGCSVSGTVRGSVLAANCRVGDASVVSDCVLLPEATIGRGCVLQRAIVDAGCRVPDGSVIDAQAARSCGGFYVSPQGVVLVTQNELAQLETALRKIA